MSNRTLGIILLSTLGLAILMGVFEEFLSYDFIEATTLLLGLVLLVFGIWIGVRLVK